MKRKECFYRRQENVSTRHSQNAVRGNNGMVLLMNVHCGSWTHYSGECVFRTLDIPRVFICLLRESREMPSRRAASVFFPAA